ncbi:MAG: aldose 1-epimerase [Bacteroidota bacterium]
MYQLTTAALGKFETHTIRSADGRQSLTCVPARGGLLTSIRLDGTEILDAYQTAEEVDFNRWGKSGLLYPFPNRLRDGRFTWNGQTYQFPVNDTDNNNALHGFGMDRNLRLMEQQLGESSAALTLVDNYQGEYPYFPWKFTLRVTYQLHETQGFRIRMSVVNDGLETIPFGLGWHPYFQLAETAADCTLQLPAIDLVGIDQRMLPTGKRYAYEEFTEQRLLNATRLDNCFALRPTDGRAEATITGSKGTLHYWQDAAQSPYLQVFTPPYGSSIALEPMTCNVDAFNNQEGLRRLPPGESMELNAGLLLL